MQILLHLFLNYFYRTLKFEGTIFRLLENTLLLTKMEVNISEIKIKCVLYSKLSRSYIIWYTFKKLCKPGSRLAEVTHFFSVCHAVEFLLDLEHDENWILLQLYREECQSFSKCLYRPLIHTILKLLNCT